MLLNLIAIVGATASGKSALAMALAERIPAEIISVDSMQVYRGLDIGTAKPSRNERNRVPHHLVDVVDLDRLFDASMFVELANEAIRGIRARGRVPVLCGGTGLYLKALLAGIGSAPPEDPKLRAELHAKPLEELLAELQCADPSLFEQIDRSNRRRLIRAIEVVRLTGRPFSSLRAGWSRLPDHLERAGIQIFGVQRDKTDLRSRIAIRVDAMFEAGLVDETRTLIGQGLEDNRNAAQAIGYRQVLEYIRGERGLTDTVALVKEKTRQYAKRQMTWFRHQLPVNWLTAQPAEPVDSLVEPILDKRNKRND